MHPLVCIPLVGLYSLRDTLHTAGVLTSDVLSGVVVLVLSTYGVHTVP